MSEVNLLDQTAAQFIDEQNTAPVYYSFDMLPNGEVYVGGNEVHEDLTRWLGGIAVATNRNTDLLEVSRLADIIQQKVSGVSI